MCLGYSDLITDLGDQYVEVFSQKHNTYFQCGNACWDYGYANIVAIFVSEAI